MNKNLLDKLRPFDAEAAKNGDSICTIEGTLVKYIAGPDKIGTVVCEYEYKFYTTSGTSLRMHPIGWLGGEPIYTSDELYVGDTHSKVTAVSIAADGEHIFVQLAKNDTPFRVLLSECSWTKPRTQSTGWINIYRTNGPIFGFIHPTEEDALAQREKDCIDTVFVGWSE